MTFASLLRIVCFGGLVSASAGAQTLLHHFTGDAAGDRLGTSVSCAGDVDGDGVPDIIAGATIDNGGTMTGLARVYSGASGATLHTFLGLATLDFFGFSVSGAGDVNGDGHADVIVGAPFDPTNGPGAGRATVFSGIDGSVIHTFLGEASNDQFGFCVAGIGDVDGDGFDDIAAGAWLHNGIGSDVGQVKVFSGVDGSIVHDLSGDSTGDNFGYSVAGAGDVDGDGFADFIVGAHRDDNNGLDSGSVRLFSGLTGLAVFTFDGDSAGDQFGYSVGGAGDIDCDGFDDVIVGARYDDNTATDAGAARVLSGATGATLFDFDGANANDEFGNAVAGGGDVDGDGFPDLIVGAFAEDSLARDSGRVRVFSGFDGSVLMTYDGTNSADRLGWSVANGQDINGDGFADPLVGARLDDNGVSADNGSVFVLDAGYSGTPGTLTIYGAGCIGGNNRLPRIGHRGKPLNGQTIRITLRGGAVNEPGCTLMIGGPALAPLDLIGLPGCTLYCNPVGTAIVGTDANGMANFDLPLAYGPGTIGFLFEFQWAMLDIGAPTPLPLTLSNALTLVVGG